MKRLILALCVVGAVGGGEAKASDDFATPVEGAYLLLQKDKFQRILSFERGGNVASVSDQQASYGFTSGQGAWKRTGQSEVTATVIDFLYSTEDGSPLGPSLIVYVLSFSDEVAPGPDDWDRVRKFQTVRGSYSGKQCVWPEPAGTDRAADPRVRHRLHRQAHHRGMIVQASVRS